VIDFKNSVLYISARSPFARRVRLAFIEHGLKYEEKVLDVFKPNPELTKINPLSRVPTLQLKSGNILIDSNQILEIFYQKMSESPLRPKSEKDLIIASRWSAVALGICDKCIEFFLETQRPKDLQDTSVFEESNSVIKTAFDSFETFIKERPTILNGSLSQADLDMGSALAYVELRLPWKWKESHPQTARYLASLSDRASFQKTQPPPPA
jgi:glutathione S-transferase